MREAALNLDQAGQSDSEHWPLRLAQQAFAAVLEERPRRGSFRRAARRATARAALSVLSLDDRGLLERWLTLQWATLCMGESSKSLTSLGSIDAPLAAAVRNQLPRVRAWLDRAESGFTVAA